MCNLYTNKSAVAEMADLFRAKAPHGFNAPADVYPGYPGLVVREDGGERVIEQMNWGFPVRLKGMKPTSKPKLVNNARDDKLLTGFWKHWFVTPAQRCLGLHYSPDDMATWTQLTGTDDILGAASFAEVFGVGVGVGVGVGAPAPGSAVPTLLACGWRMATPEGASSISGYGFWLSHDLGLTWVRHTQFPDGVFDIFNDIAGDPSSYGRFAIGWGGTGVSVLQYEDFRHQT